MFTLERFALTAGFAVIAAMVTLVIMQSQLQALVIEDGNPREVLFARDMVAAYFVVSALAICAWGLATGVLRVP